MTNLLIFIITRGQHKHLNADRRRKKTREEFQHELFLRKRSRKNIHSVRMASLEIDDALEAGDSDFSSGDECLFINNPKGGSGASYSPQC